MYKKLKKHENTVFGYKKVSKTKPENLKIFFDPKLYIETFCTVVKNLIVFAIFWILGFLGFFGKDLCIKRSKNTKSTVFGYKNGSKTKSDNWKIFFDPKLYIEIFCTFVKYCIVSVIFWILGFLVRICE